MSAELMRCFEVYRTTVSIDKVRMSVVLDHLKPLVQAYREALSQQLTDPENQSLDSLGPNERSNALQAVRRAFGPKAERPKGNCPRCAGSGHIVAYSHVRGGRCMQCEGSGSIRSGWPE